jgi:hypothetical protein
MKDVPRVAPFDACVSCFKGDTTTVAVVEGSAEFHIVSLQKLAGLTLKEAYATFDVMSGQQYGTDPGKVPVGDPTGAIRLCSDCAAKTGAQIVEKALVDAGDQVVAYREADMFPDGLETT